MRAGDLWTAPTEAEGVLKRVKELRAMVHPWQKADKAAVESRELLALAEAEKDAGIISEVAEGVARLREEVADLDIKALLSGPYDNCNVYFSLHAGAGGTESCDWAQMLLRMYERYFERSGYSAELMSMLPGEEAGIRNAHLHVKGDYAYGYLKAEMGVHRLVRISPFDSNKRRHTSFASVDATPDIEGEIAIEINPKDLRVDTYRASGAGGQHVNKTESAVRITHLATNIVVQCQTERSQVSNRATAMKMLKAKLWQHEDMKRQEDLARITGLKSSISWGSQIRSYVLQPYQLVKDLRTDHEVGNVNAVLDGEIHVFLKKYLEWQARRGGTPAASGKENS